MILICRAFPITLDLRLYSVYSLLFPNSLHHLWSFSWPMELVLDTGHQKFMLHLDKGFHQGFHQGVLFSQVGLELDPFRSIQIHSGLWIWRVLWSILLCPRRRQEAESEESEECEESHDQSSQWLFQCIASGSLGLEAAMWRRAYRSDTFSTSSSVLTDSQPLTLKSYNTSSTVVHNVPQC